MNLASALTDRSAKNIYINQNTVNLENQFKLLGIVVLKIPSKLSRTLSLLQPQIPMDMLRSGLKHGFEL
jgi:hypothetical protein